MLMFENNILYFLECKTKIGRLTPEQEYFKNMIEEDFKGWKYYIIKSIQDLVDVLKINN